MNDVELICFDMAGTTVLDNGLVLEAFRRTIEDLEVGPDEAVSAEAYVIETMGQSKIEVLDVYKRQPRPRTSPMMATSWASDRRFAKRMSPISRARSTRLRSRNVLMVASDATQATGLPP